MATGTSNTATRQQKPSSVTYFYGRITRDEAEIILKGRGQQEGLYLLRESINPLGNYALSICHGNSIHHYNIEKQLDGMYMIQDGKRFAGPVELIEHHTQNLDGFITMPQHPCNRLPFQPPVAFRGMTYTDLENELLIKAESIKGIKIEKALGPQREHLIVMVAKDLHTKQPWYHDRISRDEADKRLNADGHEQGKFLVRQRDDKKTFALTLSFKNESRHYMIDKINDKYGIQDGPKFDCIIMMIDHYHNKADGLLTKLSTPCCKPNFDRKKLQKYMENSCDNLAYAKIEDLKATSPTNGPPQPHQPSVMGRQDRPQSKRRLPPTPDEHPNFPAPSPPVGAGIPPLPHRGSHTPAVNVSGDWDDRRERPGRMEPILGIDSQKLEKIYGTVPRTEETFNLKPEQISLEDQLGAGQFGSVRKGECRLRGGKVIPVAVKTLKKEDVSAEKEMMKEARLMSELVHNNIVRMIGVCQAECIMLVLELAPLGQLNNYLHKNKQVAVSTVVELMWQVSMGMAYLESKKFVHRDLAARNVLLVTEHLAKISDFGMSKALGRENNYYEAQEAGKWPLKWYAPECVYYWKFDSKSDVWSYGVTLWEAMSYGEKPYKKMKGQAILTFLVEEDKRLEQPPRCPDGVYTVMLECWQFDKKDRPTFEQLKDKMEHQYRTCLDVRFDNGMVGSLKI